jgi:hypothetical protein
VVEHLPSKYEAPSSNQVQTPLPPKRKKILKTQQNTVSLKRSQAWWYMTIIPVIQEDDAKELWISLRPAWQHSKTLPPKKKRKICKRFMRAKTSWFRQWLL